MVKTAIWALIALFLSNILLGVTIGWGHVTPLISSVFHFLGGFFVALLLFSFYHSEFKRLSQIFATLALIGMTIGVGVIWEMTEYLGSQALTEPIYERTGYRVYFMGDLDDTINDLFMDTLGVVALVGIMRWSRRGRSNPV